jgi:hypothetical protein
MERVGIIAESYLLTHSDEYPNLKLELDGIKCEGSEKFGIAILVVGTLLLITYIVLGFMGITEWLDGYAPWMLLFGCIGVIGGYFMWKVSLSTRRYSAALEYGKKMSPADRNTLMLKAEPPKQQ